MKKSIALPVVAAVAFVVLLGLMLALTPAVGNDFETTLPETTTTEPVETTTEPPTEPPTDPPTDTTPLADLTLTAKHAFVYDCQAGYPLYIGGDPYEKLAPASLTKLLTALTVLSVLPEDRVITVGQEVTLIGVNSSVAFLQPGHQLTVKMLLQGLLLQSGNDAAYTLAAAAGRELSQSPELGAEYAISLFVDEMNRQAKSLGMENTHFANPDGNDQEGHYTCLNDLMLLSLAAMENETVMTFAGQQKADVTFHSGEICTWYNSNYFLHPEMTDFYDARVIGLKTGTTTNAGKCLISLFKTEQGPVLVGILGCPEDEARYTETRKLLETYTKEA